jgi:hypothetical protein
MSNPMETIDMLVAANTLEQAVRQSSEDGAWRVILCPDGPDGPVLKKLLAAVTGGSGRTASGGRVSVATPADGVFTSPGDKVILQRAGWARKGACRSASMLDAWEDEVKP